LKGDGILGLSAGPLGDNPHELIVPYLFYKGMIPYNIFQLDLANKDNSEEESRVIFGGTSISNKILKKAWMPLISKVHWTVYLGNVLMDDIE
jgi:hypothetical protein